MAKNAYTKFFLRTKAVSGNAFLYTRCHNDRVGRKKDIYQRWQMVSCHTARCSFATNMRLRGNDCDVICAATGHTT